MILALMSRGAVSLSLFGLVTAGAVALTQVVTADRIDDNREALARAALTAVLPAHDNAILDDQVTLAIGGTDTAVTIGRLGDDVSGYALSTVANDGYSGPITLVIGLTPSGTISGVRVTEHRETPGLGDKIDLNKSDWVLDFEGASLDNRTWGVKPDGGDFDAFTGATITPRAVTGAIARTLTWYRDEGAAQLTGSKP